MAFTAVEGIDVKGEVMCSHWHGCIARAFWVDRVGNGTLAVGIVDMSIDFVTTCELFTSVSSFH